jgi:SAM-dependent methyltransferase
VVAFGCNLCGAWNEVEQFATEPATCSCGSNVRLRALIHLLSLELFGRSMPLAEFPRLKSIRGLGMSDKDCYARLLAEKFDYTNTFYDREPRFDSSRRDESLWGQYDFILSADVLEHVGPPVETTLEQLGRMLKPHGFLGVTIFCAPSDQLREHFPELHEYRVVPLGERQVLINRRADGSLEIRDDLVFHGGTGATLEMREFGATSLRRKLEGAGFREVDFLTENLPAIGVFFDHDVSQPLIARKDPFVMERRTIAEFSDAFRAAQEEAWRSGERATQAQLAAASRWLKLGRKLGVGPKLD